MKTGQFVPYSHRQIYGLTLELPTSCSGKGDAPFRDHFVCARIGLKQAESNEAEGHLDAADTCTPEALVGCETVANSDSVERKVEIAFA